MSIFTILIDGLTLVVCGIAVSGCGKEIPTVVPTPDPTVAASSPSTNDPVVVTATATATPTATPTPNPSTVTYIYQDITICTYLHTWDPTQFTIKTYSNSGNAVSGLTYLLQWNGAFNGSTGYPLPDQDLIRSDIHGTVCTIRIRNGAYAGVTP